MGISVLRRHKNSWFLAKVRKDDWFADRKVFHTKQKMQHVEFYLQCMIYLVYFSDKKWHDKRYEKYQSVE